jgi:flagellar basal-body rod protein FlgG
VAFDALVTPRGSENILPKVKSQVDLALGPMISTDNPLDFAIKGDGFFTVEKDNELQVTRRGAFTLDADGFLTLRSGGYVLGQRGRVQLLNDIPVTLRPNGDLVQQDTVIDTLLISNVSATNMQAAGNAMYQADTLSPLNNATGLMQGYLEGSNVSSSEQMIKMMEISRHFSTSQRVLSTYDQLLDAGINRLGNN